MVFGPQAIPISEKLVEKIASLQCVDLAELMNDYQEPDFCSRLDLNPMPDSESQLILLL